MDARQRLVRLSRRTKWKQLQRRMWTYRNVWATNGPRSNEEWRQQIADLRRNKIVLDAIREVRE